MLPFTTMSYLNAYGLEDPEEARRKRLLASIQPPDPYNDTTIYPSGIEIERRNRARGFLMPQTWAGEDVAQPDASRARGAAIAALGASLLRSAPTGEWATGLSEGLSNFGQAMSGSLEQDRQFRLQKEEIERRRRLDEESKAERDWQHQKDVEEFGEWKDEKSRGQRLRAATGKSASELLSDIANVVPPDSREYKRAQALNELAADGDDQAFNKLATLHEAVSGTTSLMRKQQEEDASTARRLKGEDVEYMAGLPSAQRKEAREDVELGLRRQYYDSIEAGGKPPTTSQFANDVEQEIDRLTKSTIEARGLGGVVAVPADEIAKIRESVRQLATDSVNKRYDSYTRGGSATPPIGKSFTGVQTGASTAAIKPLAPHEAVVGLVQAKGLDGARAAMKAGGYTDEQINQMLSGL